MIIVGQTYEAIGPNIMAYFIGYGGTSPYAYTVVPDGAGGTINATTGVYKAPATFKSNPSLAHDVIQVMDADGEVGLAKILIASPLLLFCDIIKHELNLDSRRVYLWDQKLFQPTDGGLYVAVSEASCKPFGSSNDIVPSVTGMNQIQSVNMLSTLDIDIISRGPDARDRKEEVLLAINSVYSQQQQSANSFLIGRLPAGSRFINLSAIDGAAIPYRYRISINIQYAKTITQQAQHFDTFDSPEIAISI